MKIITVDNEVILVDGAAVEAPDAGSTAIPEFWESAITTAEQKIKELQDANGADCIQFVWASDTHCGPGEIASGYYSNPHNVGKLARRLMDDLNIPLLVVTGDNAENISSASGWTGTPDKACLNQFYTDIVNPVGKDKLLMLLGNHDGTSIVSNGQGGYNYPSLSKSERFNWYMRPFCNVLNRVWGGPDYYYSDFEQGKIRFICLSANNIEYVVDENHLPTPNVFQNPKYNPEQLKWLCEEALVVPDNYTIIVFSHYPSVYTNPHISGWIQNESGTPTNTDVLQGILSAYRNNDTYTHSVEGINIVGDFSNVNSMLCAVFAGHIHADTVFDDISYLPYKIVSIASAGGSNKHTREGTEQYSKTFHNNTDEETCFDVVTINKVTQKIFTTRIGVGDDREISYAKYVKTYQDVEYVGTTSYGAGVIINNNIGSGGYIEVEFEPIKIYENASQIIFNSRSSVKPSGAVVNGEVMLRYNNNGAFSGYWDSAFSGISETSVAGTKYKFKIEYNPNRGTNSVYIDDVLATTSGSNLRKYNDQAICLFSEATDGVITSTPNSGKTKIYSFKMWDYSNNLTCDLVPCYRIADNVIGFRDKVSGIFYSNSGTGTLLKGDNV